MPTIRFPRFRHNNRTPSCCDSSGHTGAPDQSVNDTQAQAQAPPSSNHGAPPHPHTDYGSGFMPPPPPPFVLLSQPPPPLQYLVYVPLTQPPPPRVEFAGSTQGDFFCESPEPMPEADQQKLRRTANPGSVRHEQSRRAHTPPPPPPPPKPNVVRLGKLGGAVPPGRPDDHLAHAGPHQPDRVAFSGPPNLPPPGGLSTAGPYRAPHNAPPPPIGTQRNNPQSYQDQRKHVLPSPPRSGVVSFNPDEQDHPNTLWPTNDNNFSEMYLDAPLIPAHSAPNNPAASSAPNDFIQTSFATQHGDQHTPHDPLFIHASGYPVSAEQLAAPMSVQPHLSDFCHNTAGPSTVPLDAPRPRYPPNHVLHSALQPQSPDSDGSPAAASPHIIVETTSLHAYTPIEEIYTSGVAPVVENTDLPRDLSPPPRPTLPPWHLAPEGNTLGLRDGEIVETVLTNNMAVAVRSPESGSGSLSSLGSGLSGVSSLRPPAAVPPATPEAVRRREEIQEFLRSASGTAKTMKPEVISEEDDERAPEEYRFEERMPEERDPEQQVVEPPELETPELPDVSVTPPSRSRSRSNTDPVHTNSEGFHFTVVPPTTVASTNTSLDMLSPPSIQEHISNETTVTPEVPQISIAMSPSLGPRPPQKSPLRRERNLAPETPRRPPNTPQPRPKVSVATQVNATAGPSRPTPSPSEQTKVANSSCFLTPDRCKSPAFGTSCMSSTMVSPSNPSCFTQQSFKSQHLAATSSEDLQSFGERRKAKRKAFPRPSPSPVTSGMDWCGYHGGMAGDSGNSSGSVEPPIEVYSAFQGPLGPPPLLFSRENRAMGATRHMCPRTTRNAHEDDGMDDQSYHLQVLARRCIIEVTRMSEDFDKCGTLSSGILASAKTTYAHLREALSPMLELLEQEIEEVDENTSAEISWHDRHADILAAVHRASTRVMVLTEEFPRADKIREHLKSVKGRADRLKYLTPKLKDSLDSMTMLRLRATLLAKQEQAKNAARTEEARRGTFKSWMDRQKSERDQLRQQMRRLRRARNDHSESEDDEVSSLASE